MKPRQITLPEPASRIWKHATTLVDALVEECKTLEDQQWYLGGGTALSADWHHRRSTDIDILIAPGLSMAALHGKGYERLEELIEATGGTRINAPDQKLSVIYGDDGKDGKIDIFSSGRQLPGHEEPIEIGGRAAMRLSNAQIFAGKFRRAIDHHVAARDLFDICHSVRIKDPGMQQALNALTEPEVERIREFWENSSSKIEKEAQDKLWGMPREHRIDADELVPRTVRTTEDHRYGEVLVLAGYDETRIRTITNSGRTNEYRSASADIERDFNALGIARHLMQHNISPRQVMQDARKAMTQSIEQTVARTAPADGRKLQVQPAGAGNEPPDQATASTAAGKQWKHVSIGDLPKYPTSAPDPAGKSNTESESRSRDIKYKR